MKYKKQQGYILFLFGSTILSCCSASYGESVDVTECNNSKHFIIRESIWFCSLENNYDLAEMRHDFYSGRLTNVSNSDESEVSINLKYCGILNTFKEPKEQIFGPCNLHFVKEGEQYRYQKDIENPSDMILPETVVNKLGDFLNYEMANGLGNMEKILAVAKNGETVELSKELVNAYTSLFKYKGKSLVAGTIFSETFRNSSGNECTRNFVRVQLGSFYDQSNDLNGRDFTSLWTYEESFGSNHLNKITIENNSVFFIDGHEVEGRQLIEWCIQEVIVDQT